MTKSGVTPYPVDENGKLMIKMPPKNTRLIIIQFRDFIKAHDLSEDEICRLAREYIVDTYQIKDFLEYLKQVVAGEI